MVEFLKNIKNNLVLPVFLLLLCCFIFSSCEKEEETDLFGISCLHCEGTGICWFCDGTGDVGFVKCTSCKGTGQCKYCKGK